MGGGGRGEGEEGGKGGEGEGGRLKRVMTVGGGGREEEVLWEWRLIGEDWVQVFCGEEKKEEIKEKGEGKEKET